MGQIFDSEGNALPGVTVTISHRTISPMSTISSADGVFRFLSLFPGQNYIIKAELEGFKTRIEEGVIVAVGITTELRISMEMGALEEEVTVTAVSPVIDTKKTAVTTTTDYTALQSLPTARDPWVILQMTPSIEVDRENVGGSESGQQAGFTNKGGARGDATWTVDGINITDPAARGASPGYYDFDVFEEVQVTTGGADVQNQSGGVALNLVSRRGGNQLSLGGRFFYTDQRFQSKGTGSVVEQVATVFPNGPGYNEIIDIKDFGFNVGGPVIKDKMWWWISYGVQEIMTNILTGASDNTYLNNYGGKFNLQLVPENRLEFFFTAGKKEKLGRSSSSSFPLGLHQRGRFHFGSPVFKIQDEHMFGDNLFVSLKLGYTNAGFGTWPMGDEELDNARFYSYDKRLHENDTYSWYMYARPNKQFQLMATYFNDELFGASHEIKMGVELVDRRQGYVGGSPGNIRFYHEYTSKQLDWDGDGKRDYVWRDLGVDLHRLNIYKNRQHEEVTKAYVAFLSDTLTFGRLTLTLGVRYDRQVPIWNGGTVTSAFAPGDADIEGIDSNYQYYDDIWSTYFEAGVAAAIKPLIPWVNAEGVEPDFSWDMIAPRIGLSWDITGDGKTIAKASFGQYGEFFGTWAADYWAPRGTGGWLRFWWWDENGNDTVGLDELYWADYDKARTAYRAFDDSGNFVGDETKNENLGWGGYTFGGSTLTPNANTIGDNFIPERTTEFLATLEREITPDFAVAVDFTFRRYDQDYKDVDYYPDTGYILQNTDYVVAGQIPDYTFTFTNSMGDTITTSTGAAAGRDYYLKRAGLVSTGYDYVDSYGSERHNDFYGVDLRFNKRLSNKWMLNGSFTLQTQKRYRGTENISNWYETNRWTLEGGLYASSLGESSGKINQLIFSKWMIKAQGLYQLPYDINVSFTFNARQGHMNIEWFDLVDEDWVNPQAQSVSEIYTEEFGSFRLPTFYNLSFRLEKMLRLGDTGKIYLMADLFNVFNNNVMNRQHHRDIGTLYVSDMTFSRNRQYFEPNEVLNPRVVRFGVRFQF